MNISGMAAWSILGGCFVFGNLPVGCLVTIDETRIHGYCNFSGSVPDVLGNSRLIETGFEGGDESNSTCFGVNHGRLRVLNGLYHGGVLTFDYVGGDGPEVLKVLRMFSALFGLSSTHSGESPFVRCGDVPTGVSLG